MKRIIVLVIAALSLAFSAKAENLTFGEDVTMELYQPLATVMNEPNKFVDQQITLKGKIEKVCKKRGCWADIVSKDKRLRIKVADGEINLPIHAIGRVAYATGTLVAKELNQEQATAYLQHMAQDAGEEFDKSTVKSGMTLYQLKSNAVKIL